MRSWVLSTSRPTRSPTAAAISTPEAAVAHGMRAGGCRRRDPRRRRRIDAPRRGRGRRGRRGAQGRARRAGDCAPAVVPVSIDTTKAAVAAAAIDPAGARVVNDVSGGSADSGLLGVVADAGAMLVVMHMRGTPRTMRGSSLRRRRARGRRRTSRPHRRRGRRRCRRASRSSPTRASDSRRRSTTILRCSARFPSSRRASKCRCSSAPPASRSSVTCWPTRPSMRVRRRRSR